MIIRTLAILAAVAAASQLGGCATTAFDNVASCSLAGDELLVSSMYGAIGVTSKVRQADARVACAKPAAAASTPGKAP